MITLGGLAAMLLFGALGVWRGGLRMLASLLALLLAGLLAYPLSGIGSALLGITGLVPRSLLGVAGLVTTGIIFFILFTAPTEWQLRKREAALKEAGQPSHSDWERLGGALLGVVWGTLVTILVLTGIATIGQTQRAVRLANAEITYRAERRRTETLRVNQIARLTHQRPQAISPTVELEEIDDSKLPASEPSRAEELSADIDKSLFGSMVRDVEPMDKKSEQTLRDLNVAVGDPYLFDRFQSHPQVQALMQEPKIKELSTDAAIAAAIREGRYRDLLDNEKVAEVATDKQLAAKLKALKLAELLHQIRTAGTPKIDD